MSMTRQLPGGPAILERQGNVTIRQRKVVGRLLVALSPGIPLMIALVSGQSPAAAWEQAAALDAPSRWVAAGIALILAAVFAYGLFWLLWRRELAIDTVARRYVFISGVGPLVSRRGGPCDDPLKMAVGPRRIGGTGSSGDIGSQSGADVAYWHLQLVLPGGLEPFHVGTDADRAAAVTAAQDWRGWFPQLVVE